jgi:hypothetical protein
MNFKVILRNFSLPVIHENVHAESSELLDNESEPAGGCPSKEISEVSESNVSPDDPSNVQECTMDVESPKGRFRR